MQYYHSGYFKIGLLNFIAYSTVLEDNLFKIRIFQTNSLFQIKLLCVNCHIFQNVTKQRKMSYCLPLKMY